MKLSRLTMALCMIALIIFQSAVPAAFGETGEEAFALPQGRVGDAYKFQIELEGGMAPFKWRVVGGELPPGIELLTTGALRGEPTTARRTPYVFAVEVSDSSTPPQRFVQQLAVSIQAAPLRMVLGATPLKIVAPKGTRAIGPYMEATGKEIRLPEDSAPEEDSSSAHSAEPPKNKRASGAKRQSGVRGKADPKTKRASVESEKSEGEDEGDEEDDSPGAAAAEKPPCPNLKTPLVEGDTTIQVTATPGATVTVFVNKDKLPSQEADKEGNVTFILTAPKTLAEGDVVRAQQTVDDVDSDTCLEIKVKGPQGDFSWGRVRAFFSGGVIFSKEREDFSKQDIFLALNVDKNWIWSERFNFNTYLDVRLTSLPINTTDEETPDPLDTFIASKKSALMQLGAYAPILLRKWKYPLKASYENNSLFIAPILKAGIQTITGEQTSAERINFGKDDVFNFGAFGLRFGHMNLSKTKDEAHEILSYLDITRGKWENFELIFPTIDPVTGMQEQIPDPNDSTKTIGVTFRERRWRWGFEGRLKIPSTPFQVGFDANLGDGADDVRFIFGAKFDIGRLFGKLGLPK